MSHPSFLLLGIVWECRCSFLFEYLVKCNCDATWFRICVCWQVFKNYLLYFVIGLFRYSIFCLVLNDYIFLGIYSFFHVSNLLTYICLKYFLIILCISVVSVVTSLSCLILFIWLPSLFSGWVWLKVYQFCCLFSPRTSSWFIDPFFFYFVYFCSGLYLLPSHFGLCLLFFL